MTPEKPRVLVVDDESSVRDILQDFLEFEGFEVTLAETGEAGLELVLTRPFDVVLTDLEMPKMNGIDFLRELEDMNNPPAAIMMTGYGTVESAIEAMKIGAYDYILKPFQIEELVQLIRKALEHKRLEEENIRLHEMVALYRVSERLNDARSVNEVAEVATESVTAELKPDLFCFWKLEGGQWVQVKTRRAEGCEDDAATVLDRIDSVAVLKAVHDEHPLVLNGGTGNLFFHGDEEPFHSAVLAPLKIQGRVIGMLGAFLLDAARTYTEGNRKTLQLYADRAAVSIDNVRLYENLQQTFLQTIESLVGALEAKDEYTRGHSERVSQWALHIGRLMDLDASRMEDLRRAALLHDIGKIGLNLEALNRPGKLTPEEYDRFKLHPVLSKRILEPIEFLEGSLPMVLHHHEHWDGNGYPMGLAGREIPLGARILAIADAFEVMVTDRVYRKALPLEEAIAELKRCAGSQFDPGVVERFVNWVSQFETTENLPVRGGRREVPEEARREEGADEQPRKGGAEPYTPTGDDDAAAASAGGGVDA